MWRRGDVAGQPAEVIGDEAVIPLLLNRWVQLAAGTALGLVLGFGLGHHQKTLEDASAALAGTRKAVVVAKAQGSVTSTVDQHTTAAVGAIQTRTVTLIQKVPVYVSRKADDQCIVSNGARSLLDAAGTGPVPAAPSGLSPADTSLANPDADSGVKLSAIVSADIVNAGNYAQLAERLRAWDEWFDQQSKLASTR
jgi:hypothetical protein